MCSKRQTSAAPPPKKATLSACVRSRVCTARKAPSSRYWTAASDPKSGVTALRTQTRFEVDKQDRVLLLLKSDLTPGSRAAIDI